MTVMPRVCPVISILPLFVIACVGHATGSDDPGGDSAIGPDPDPDPGPAPAPAADAPAPPPATAAPPPPPPSAARLVAYFAAWSVYGRDYHVAEIPADHLTHL